MELYEGDVNYRQNPPNIVFTNSDYYYGPPGSPQTKGWNNYGGFGFKAALEAGMVTSDRKYRAVFHHHDPRGSPTMRERKLFVKHCVNYAFNQETGQLHPAYVCPRTIKPKPKGWTKINNEYDVWPKLTAEESFKRILTAA